VLKHTGRVANVAELGEVGGERDGISGREQGRFGRFSRALCRVQRGGIFRLGPAAVPSLAADKENATGRKRVALLEAIVKNLRSEIQVDAIDMGGLLLVSCVGTEDWVVKNQASSSPPLFLDPLY
jgi:hypothetical protein